MRLTIVPDDGFVSIDNVVKALSIDLTSCNIPTDIHALQWYDNRGWIEYEDSTDPFAPKQPNLDIYSLPEWAITAVTVYNNYIAPVATPEPPPTEFGA